MDTNALRNAALLLLAALGEATPAEPTPAKKKAGKGKTAADKPAAASPKLALTGEERKALRAEFRAEHGPNWHTDPTIKAEYDRRAWAKRPATPAAPPTALPAAAPAVMAAEGGLDNMGLRALRELRKSMGLKGAFGESATVVREQIRAARAAAEPRVAPKGKGKARRQSRREVC